MSENFWTQKCTIGPAVTFLVFSFLISSFFVGKVHMSDSLISGLFGDWGYIGRVYIFFGNQLFCFL